MPDIPALARRGDDFADAGNPRAALRYYEEALAAFAALPRGDEARTLATQVWLLSAKGDAHLQLDEPLEARATFTQARAVTRGREAAFLDLRLGQIALRLGDEAEAYDHLLRAFSVGREALFLEADDPAALDWLIARAQRDET